MAPTVFWDQKKGRRSGEWKVIVRRGDFVEYVPIDHEIGPADKALAEKAAVAIVAERLGVKVAS